MTPLRLLGACALMAGLAACGADPASRNAPFELPPPEGVTRAVAVLPEDLPQRPAAVQPRFQIVDYAIKVPEELKVSEANLYYPVTDIVWRGDPYGNRKEQVARIFEEGLTRAMPQLDGARPARLDIVVNRFHSLTEKTRYTVGGVHSISFFVTVRDPESGAVLVETRKVKADLNAFGGTRAMAAEAQGLTMKERIQRHLARVLVAELTLPGGWADNGRQLSRGIDHI